jgi:hypothetical protein
MSFTSYARATDVEEYAPGMVAQFWGGKIDEVDHALSRASRKINEWLRGLDRFSDGDVPVAQESDGSYAEVLVELTVYMAAWAKVRGELAGEAFEDHWSWLPAGIRELKGDIARGQYSFGSDGDKASSGSPFVVLRRGSI